MGFKTKEDALKYGEKWSPGHPYVVMTSFVYDEWEVYWDIGPITVHRDQRHFPDKFYARVDNYSNNFSDKYDHGKPYCDSVEDATKEEIVAFLKFAKTKREHLDEIQSEIEKTGIKLL